MKIMVEKRDFSYPLAFNAPIRGVPVGISAPLWYGKTRMVSLPYGEKISKMFIRFDVIHERDGQTLHDSKDRAYASHRAVIKRGAYMVFISFRPSISISECRVLSTQSNPN